MKALVNFRILKKETIEIMKHDSGKFFLGIDYGYGLMIIRTVPVIMPAKYIIGTMNRFGYGKRSQVHAAICG